MTHATDASRSLDTELLPSGSLRVDKWTFGGHPSFDLDAEIEEQRQYLAAMTTAREFFANVAKAQEDSRISEAAAILKQAATGVETAPGGHIAEVYVNMATAILKAYEDGLV